MRQRDDMTFPFEEYARRLGDLRRRMADRLLDAVVITDPENLMYLYEKGWRWFSGLYAREYVEATEQQITVYIESNKWYNKGYSLNRVGRAT